MIKLTKDIIQEKIDAYNDEEESSIGDFLTEYANRDDWNGNCKDDDSMFGIVTVVEEIGGGEGGGETVKIVYYFEKYNQYFQIDGYYTSHYGTEFDDGILEVFPREVVVTQYFPE